MTVAVLGAGTIGLCVIQAARAAGAAHVWATDLPAVPHRLAAAAAFGATPVTASGGQEAAAIQKDTGGRGVDVAFGASLARRKDLEIRVVRRMKHTHARAIQLLGSGRVDVRSLVTHRFPLVAMAHALASTSGKTWRRSLPAFAPLLFKQ